MQNLTKALTNVGEALEEGKRAFGQLASELEILTTAYRTARQELEEGLKRERELLDILKTRGLAADAPEPTTGGAGP